MQNEKQQEKTNIVQEQQEGQEIQKYKRQDCVPDFSHFENNKRLATFG